MEEWHLYPSFVPPHHVGWGACCLRSQYDSASLGHQSAGDMSKSGPDVTLSSCPSGRACAASPSHTPRSPRRQGLERAAVSQAWRRRQLTAVALNETRPELLSCP